MHHPLESQRVVSVDVHSIILNVLERTVTPAQPQAFEALSASVDDVLIIPSGWSGIGVPGNQKFFISHLHLAKIGRA